MANSENLKKGVLTQFRSGEEAARNGRKGGIASGESRRRTARFRDTFNRLLTMQAEVEGLSDVLRADGGESTYEEIICMAMIEKAARGDSKAFEAIAKYSGQSSQTEADLEEQRIRTDRAKRARDQEVGDTDSGNENIQSFLKAMKPTQEDIDALFANAPEEEEDDAEEAEETSEV